MFEKLEAVEKRYDELTTQISDPAIIANNNEWRKLIKEHSSMEDVVVKYKEYKQIENNMNEAKEMMEDPEMKELAEEEYYNSKEKLSKIEEELVDNKNKMSTLQKLNMSFELAKDILQKSYDEMKNTVTPKFTEALSKNISNITSGKYSNIMFNEEQGLIVELENGNYVPASKLSIGTIDQLYLSLRLSATKEITKETIPIILDESFAYFDNQRLENVIKYLDSNYNNQIIIFTCTNREKEILDKLNIEYNLVNL